MNLPCTHYLQDGLGNVFTRFLEKYDYNLEGSRDVEEEEEDMEDREDEEAPEELVGQEATEPFEFLDFAEQRYPITGNNAMYMQNTT